MQLNIFENAGGETKLRNNKFFVHKITGEKLKIIKIYGNVAKCELEKELIFSKCPYLSIKICICSIENLL